MKASNQTQQKNIVLDLANSVILRQAGWANSTVFSWCVDYTNPEEPCLLSTDSVEKDDVVAGAPTVSELLKTLPTTYNDLHIRINAWGDGPKKGYGVSYCQEDGSADFLTEADTLEEALATMWQWINSNDCP